MARTSPPRSKDSEYPSFVLASGCGNPAVMFVYVHEAGRTANEGFIGFYLFASPAEFKKPALLHRKANPVKHEPCGFLSDTQSAGNLIGTDAILPIGNHPNGDKPLIQRQSRILKDSPDFDAELFPGMLAFALPHAASRDKANFVTPASGALDAIGPAPLNHEVEAVIEIGEIGYGLLQGLGLFHGVPHKTNRSRNAVLSQVYYCLNKS